MSSKTKVFAVIGMIILFFQAVVSSVTLYKVRKFDALPTKYMVLLVFCLTAALILICVLQFFRIANVVADVVAVLLIIALIWMAGAVGKVQDTLDNKIQAKATKDIGMQVIVMDTSESDDIKDYANESFGMCSAADTSDYPERAIQYYADVIGNDITVVDYSSEFDMARALVKGEIKVAIINAAHTAMIDDMFFALDETDECYLGLDEGNPIGLTDVTRVIDSYVITEKVEEPTGIAEEDGDRELISTSISPFVIYISGIDTEGDISTVSRSDVNVLVCVNPVTKQILFVTTPRDSYVQIPEVSGRYYDKLTHAGLYGSKCSASIATLENIFGVDVDFYMRVNFTSAVNVVDALGGVSIYSDYTFESQNVKGYSFYKGYNDVDGEAALAFCRERYSFPDGDYQRGRNHTEMVKAILKKAMSPAILSAYTDILDEVATNIETNMTTSEITELVKMQLGDGAEWNFVTWSIEGINGGAQQLRTCYSSGSTPLYVTILDNDSIQTACDLMEKVLNGETITQPERD